MKKLKLANDARSNIEMRERDHKLQHRRLLGLVRILTRETDRLKTTYSIEVDGDDLSSESDNAPVKHRAKPYVCLHAALPLFQLTPLETQHCARSAPDNHQERYVAIAPDCFQRVFN
jgi:hypothetical protein